MPTHAHERTTAGLHARRAAALIAAASFALAQSIAQAAPAKNGDASYAFAVVSGAISSPADEAAAQRMFDAISRERDLAFVVYAGNLKGPQEACRDALYLRRDAILTAARAPTVFAPGHDDWITCGTVAGGSYDPIERLDFLRQTLLADSASPAPNALQIARESEVPRFHPYRENARWTLGDTVYVTLNVPAPNNHYLIAGGRNGEFEDRVIANGFWIEHSAEYAKRRGVRALVIFFEANPQFDRYERAERFAWLRFTQSRGRDGFHELKRSLAKAATIFRGPIVVVHASGDALPSGFAIDRPLHLDNGELVGNVTRIAIGPRHPSNQWVRIVVNPARRTPFDVSLRDVPKNLPAPPALPSVPHDDTPLPPMPEIPALPALPDSSSEAPPLQGGGAASGSSAPGPAPLSAPTPDLPAASSVQRAP
jgi:hypothetical protein